MQFEAKLHGKARAIGDLSGRFRKRIVAKIKAKLAVVVVAS
jgi:hypothetical protein